MSLMKLLEVDESRLPADARQSILLAERVWREQGSPAERWQLVRALEEILQRCIASGIWYAPILLRRKKAMERDSWRPRPRGEARSAATPSLSRAVLPAVPASAMRPATPPGPARVPPANEPVCPVCHGTALKVYPNGFRSVCMRCKAWEKGFPSDLGPVDEPA